MAVKTSAPYSGVGSAGRGYKIPAGSLDTWRAARDASATTRKDVLCSGDSTTAGGLAGSLNGSWVGALRAIAVAAGVTDGGRGQISGIYDDATASGESFAAFVSRTGWATGSPNSTPGPLIFSSTVVGDVLTLQYKAPSNAVRIRCSSYQSTGLLTVKVNGVTVGTIQPWVNKDAANGGVYGQKVKVFTGLTAGGSGQTLTIENTGGATIPNPSQFRTAGTASTGGALAPGSYTYAATFVDAGGLETALSPTGNQTVPAGTSTNTVTTALDVSPNPGNVPPGITKVRLYRATGTGVSNPASFQRVLEVNNNGGAQVVLVDVGNAPGAAPPSSTQSPQFDQTVGGPKTAGVAVEFFDSTKGITFHRAGYIGQKYASLYRSDGNSLSTCGYDMQTHMGLVPGLPGLSGANFDWNALKDTSSDARKVCLAICAFGINDMNLYSSLTSDLQAVTQGCSTFIKAARSAGADPLVVIPHLEFAGDAIPMQYVGLFRQAIVNTADAHNAAWVDFSYALGTPQGGPAVHLSYAQYTTQAQFLWDNVLSK
jgi:hypothetical protein